MKKLKDDPDSLRVVGELLYGPQWQSALARDLEVAIRTMQRWVARDFNIPAGVWLSLADLCEERAESLHEIKRELVKLANMIEKEETG